MKKVCMKKMTWVLITIAQIWMNLNVQIIPEMQHLSLFHMYMEYDADILHKEMSSTMKYSME